MAILASDTFSGASTGPPLGGNWVLNTSVVTGFKIVSGGLGLAQGRFDADDMEHYDGGITWPNDQYAQCVFGDVTTTAITTGDGLALRCIATVNVHTGYRLCVGTHGWELQRIVANSFTSLASNASPAFANGDTLYFSCSGQSTVTFVMKRNGVEFNAGTVDSSGSRLLSGYPGVGHSGASDNTTTRGLTSWEAGNPTYTLDATTGGSLALAGQSVTLRPGSTTYLRYRK